ncbi:MAG: serine hydrolase domain-containing protein [Planctomycetaceae bacterium]
MRTLTLPVALCAILLTSCNHRPVAAEDAIAGLTIANPSDLGINVRRLQIIEEIVQQELSRDRMPGCVILIGYRGSIVYHEAFGHRQLQPEPLPMDKDTVFDMASLTKPMATATSVMKLVEDGQVELDAPVSTYIPEFTGSGKDTITVQQLLTHTGGLIPDNAMSDYENGPDTAFERIHSLGLISDPGTKFGYSDVGFIVLGELVERVSGSSVHEYSQRAIFEPLQMSETGFLPAEPLRARAAPTEQRDGHWMQGEVHDPRAFALGGIAGHAGLFSTARDMARYAQMMLNQGSLGGVQVLKPETVERMTAGVEVSSGLRTAGWDMRSPYSSNRGDLMSSSAYGHGGFTGTGMWIDPELQLFVIFLSNRVHPDGKGSVNPLIGRIGTIAAAALPE